MRKNFAVVLLLVFLCFFYLIGSWTFFKTTRTVEFPGEGVYSGEFRGHTFHGQGTWESLIGITYIGDFKNGTFHGIGTMTSANGASYQGGFKEGFMHGYGVMTFPNGHIHEGYWDADIFLGDPHDCDDH